MHLARLCQVVRLVSVSVTGQGFNNATRILQGRIKRMNLRIDLDKFAEN